MEPVPLTHLAADPEPRFVEIAKDQPQYKTLPALLFHDGRVLTEWSLSEAERVAITRGENIRLWIEVHPQRCTCGQLQPRRLQPVALEVTTEDRA